MNLRLSSKAMPPTGLLVAASHLIQLSWKPTPDAGMAVFACVLYNSPMRFWNWANCCSAPNCFCAAPRAANFAPIDDSAEPKFEMAFGSVWSSAGMFGLPVSMVPMRRSDCGMTTAIRSPRLIYGWRQSAEAAAEFRTERRERPDDR